MNNNIELYINMRKPKVKQANFLIPEEVLRDLRRWVPWGEQSQVVTEALRRALKRRKMESALQKSFGAWGRRPELGSTRSFVRKLRRERRFPCR